MYSEKQEHHEMILEKTHDSGAEEWYCPSCGRRCLMQWSPEFEQIVLDLGDDNAQHRGSKSSHSSHVSPSTEEDALTSKIDPGLQEWEDLLNRVDFESWWHKEIK